MAQILHHLLKERTSPPRSIPQIPEGDIMQLLRQMQTVFANENVLLRIRAPINVCGDLHGQYSDLLRIFELNGYPPMQRYLFLGDYVDRGSYSIETIILLFSMKLVYPDHVFLLRGNHEDEALNRTYGFYDECKRKYSTKLWKNFVNCFNYMPVSALINQNILCMHGGLSPSMKYISDIESISRPSAIPDEGILCDLLWSDPDAETVGWGANDRGVSYVFGADIVKEFCERNQLDLIVRAHEVVEDAYQFFANQKLLTIFSAPAYCGEYENAAGILCVDRNLRCSIKTLDPSD